MTDIRLLIAVHQTSAVPVKSWLTENTPKAITHKFYSYDLAVQEICPWRLTVSEGSETAARLVVRQASHEGPPVVSI